MNENIENIARAGYVSKGMVYGITGILALKAAIGLGGSSEGKLGVLKFLEDQPFGNLLLGLVGLGLLCYAFWRFFQSIRDPENIGDSLKGIGKRTGFFFSGLVYLGLGVFSFYEIFKESGTNGNSTGKFLPVEYLNYIFYTIALGLLIKAIFQFSKVHKGNFLSKLNLSNIAHINMRTTVKWLGYAGLVSRGIVVSIVAYFFFKAANTAGRSDIKGTADAFSFLRQNSEGPLLVGLVAFGLICYGIYMFVMAKYRRFNH